MFSYSSIRHCLRGFSRLTVSKITSVKIATSDLSKAAQCKTPNFLGRPIHMSSCRRDLMEFFDDEKNWGAEEVKVGRAWKAEELRLKSNQDLHKLWYVLLKERNMLLTAEHYYEKVEKELFPSPERIDKVEESMKNLELVVKERNKAYWQLEVSEAEDGCRPVRRERSEFGIMTDRPLTEHVEPETEENRFRPARPYQNQDVASFLALRREAERTEQNRVKRRERRHVMALLKRFPDLDEQLLREKFPEVDLEEAKRHKRARGNHENWS